MFYVILFFLENYCKKFIGKHLCQSLFFIKCAGLRSYISIKALHKQCTYPFIPDFNYSNLLPHYPSWIHPGKFPSDNEAYKISPHWKRFGFSTSPVCIGNVSHPDRNFELLMFPGEFLKFWYFPGDIAQTVFGPWFAASVYNQLHRL